ncbi:SdrD B-like domain-containing protein, partial [Ferruginibacter sp. SUN002]|uniref:SdrD B-like domain-containing protein n=1 Tax=Ferruginibacter sp. SUN002 TaxID=2937789 RepID=UPI003D3640DE
NGAGCASVDTLHLTVNYGTHNASTQVACETYNWHGTDYTTSGDYTYSYTNGAGCASVDTLHLTVNYGTHNTTTQVACETYNWHGTDYTTSGDYTYSYTNGAGCASVDTLHLTVNYGTHNATTQVACETYNWHGTEYTTSGDYTYSYTNGVGCASVDTLHLIIKHGTHNVTTQVVCDTYNWHGTDYTTSGDYTYNYTNGVGCASVDTLHLTVNYCSSIGNSVWYDKNNNGIKDANEIGVSGITVKLYDCSGTYLNQTTTTDANGNYQFNNVSAGNYVVGITTTSDYAKSDAGSTNANVDDQNDGVNIVGSEIQTNCFTINGSNDNIDFGLKGLGSIGDLVWNDFNGNGIQDDGEPGIGGATVTLTYPSGSTISVLTDAKTGMYLFSNLAPGTYSLTFVTPAGLAPTLSAQGGDNALDSDPVNGVVSNIALSATQSISNIDAGFYAPFGSIGDKVWIDANKNGIQEGSEAGAAGITVSLLNISGSVIATTVTDASGNFTFTNVPVALGGSAYQVRFTLPITHKFSPERAGGDANTDSDPNTSTGTTGYITLTPGDKFKSDIDAGIYTIATVLPVKILDLNGVNKNSEVQLSWIATTEQGFKQFEIEYSSDGYTFTKIATISGTSNEKSSYSYAHTSPSSGVNYYRLKSVDINGTFSYSNSIAVKVGVTIGIVNAYPNPFTDRIDINFQSQNSNKITIRMIDISGKAIRSMTGKINSGNNHLVVGNLSNLQAGTYILEIVDLSDNAAYRYKLVKQ